MTPREFHVPDVRLKPELGDWRPDAETERSNRIWISRVASMATSDEIFDKHRDKFMEWYARASERCESPIEYHLVTGMFAFNWKHGEKPILLTFCDDAGEFTKSPGRVCMMNQCQFFGYRMDFAMKFQRVGAPVLLCVEADGKAYHNDSKDEARDKALKARGMHTLRFSGRKINDDPTAICIAINRVAKEIELTGEFRGFQQ